MGPPAAAADVGSENRGRTLGWVGGQSDPVGSTHALKTTGARGNQSFWVPFDPGPCWLSGVSDGLNGLQVF